MAWPLNWMSFCCERQFFAGGDADLRLHDVDAGDEFGHRVFDLHPGVHFDEIELAVFVEKLEGAGAAIADLAAGLGAAFADLVAQFGVESGRGRFFQHFLVAALHRAVTFAQMDRVAMFVGQNLDFDMAWRLQEFFHVDHGVAEEALRFRTGHGHRIQQRGFGMDHAHAASAAAACCLDDDRVADLGSGLDDFVGIVRQGALRAGHARHLGFDHGLLGGHLVAHQADVFGARADEGEAGRFDALGKIGVFGQKAVAGMDRSGVGDFGRGDDRRHMQIALRGRCRADADRFVGQLHILGVAVGLGIHGDRLDAHFAAGTLDAKGDFAAVGDENFFKHGDSSEGGRVKGEGWGVRDVPSPFPLHPSLEFSQ